MTEPQPPLAGPARFRVVSVEDGMTLRQLLAKRLGVPSSQAAEIVRAGGVHVGQVRMCVPTLRVAEGERVTVYRAAAEVRPLDPAALRVLHRDDTCVVVDKPHGVPAAATKANSRGSLAHALVQLLAGSGVLRPYVGLVHPLPTEAAGAALFTIRGQSTESFYKEFAAAPTTRRFRVRLAGRMPGDHATCDAPLARTPAGAWRLARAGDRDVVAASTRFDRIAELGDETLAAVTLQRGESWELLRLHAGSLGLPIVGEGDAASTLCLLAEHLAFTHPRTGAAVAVTAELPPWAQPGE